MGTNGKPGLAAGALATLHTGSCHCGRVRFKVEGLIDEAMACNCSICRRKGSLLWFVPRASLTLLTPDEDASTYTFNRHVIKHRFCPVCGIHTFGEGTAPAGQRMAAINLRCIEGLDLATIRTTPYDGAAT